MYIPSRLVNVSFYVHVLIVHVFEYSYNLFVVVNDLWKAHHFVDERMSHQSHNLPGTIPLKPSKKKMTELHIHHQNLYNKFAM